VARNWATWKPSTRRSEVEEVAAWLPALGTRQVGEREHVYTALKVVLNPSKEATRAQEDVWRRLVAASRPLSSLRRVHMEDALAACRTKIDGTKASPNYYSRRRANLAQVLTDAVADELLGSYPLSNHKEPKALKASTKVKATEVGEAHQVMRVLDVIGSVSQKWQVLFALMYYAGLRPGEAVMVRWGDLVSLPAGGWGVLRARSSSADAGSAYTDTGETRQETGLKWRKEGATRTVPLPPVLVAALGGVALVGPRGGAS
jgi:integrase